MDVSITQFRRQLFSLVNQALEGQELWVSHKGQRLRLMPEQPPVGRLARITPLALQVQPQDDLADPALSTALLDQMSAEWEKDWAKL